MPCAGGSCAFLCLCLQFCLDRMASSTRALGTDGTVLCDLRHEHTKGARPRTMQRADLTFLPSIPDERPWLIFHALEQAGGG
jgi:hypothetical protein